jgi:predicted acyl esterase
MVCPDGVRLATRVWTPGGAGPWPVLLMRQPYGRAIASTVTYAHPRWYAERGFLVAVQDVRGRGDSEGSFRGFAGEAADGAAAVRWVRALPGSNGRVGTYGFSYQGLSQLLNGGSSDGAAGEQDPALPDCLAPAMAGLDEGRHWAWEGQAHWWNLGLSWALQLAAEGCRRRGDGDGWGEIRRCLVAGTQPEQGLALLERHDPEGMGLGWLRNDPRDRAAWRRHSPPAALLRRPMLLIGGWHDPHLEGVLDLWRRSREAGGRPGLVVGPWTHLDWGDGLDALQLAFFRRHLQAQAHNDPGGCGGCDATSGSPQAGDAHGADPVDGATQPGWPGMAAALANPELAPALAVALEGGIALAGEGATGWFTPRTTEPAAIAQPQAPGAAKPRCGDEEGAGHGLIAVVQTPGATAEAGVGAGDGASRLDTLSWQLCSDGRAAVSCGEGLLLEERELEGKGAADENGVAASVVMLVHDPWRPVPARGGHLGLPPGVVDRSDLDQRGDVACFTTPPLAEERWLVGRPVLRLEARADQPGFDLVAALSLLPADGDRVWQLSTGVLRVLGGQALDPAPRRLALQPLALRLRPGERLRLALAGAAWPAIAVNAGDGTLPMGGPGPGHRVISLELRCAGARLELEPLLSRESGAD